jgi:flagellar assembly factor FliW
MLINTTRFGTIEVKEDSVLSMPAGMLGFESCRRFILLQDEPGTAFKWLQAMDDPSVAFILVNPTDFFPNYEVELTDNEAEALEIETADEAVMFTTVSIDKSDGTITTNLAGPIVMNLRTLQARQVVLQNDRYLTRHVIGERVSKDASQELAKAA